MSNIKVLTLSWFKICKSFDEAIDMAAKYEDVFRIEYTNSRERKK